MTAIFGLLYLLFLLFVITASIFVVWHLLRYSMNKALSLALVIIFLIVTGILLLSNITLFTQIPFEEMFENSSAANTFSL